MTSPSHSWNDFGGCWRLVNGAGAMVKFMEGQVDFHWKVWFYLILPCFTMFYYLNHSKSGGKGAGKKNHSTYFLEGSVSNVSKVEGIESGDVVLEVGETATMNTL